MFSENGIHQYTFNLFTKEIIYYFKYINVTGKMRLEQIKDIENKSVNINFNKINTLNIFSYILNKFIYE